MLTDFESQPSETNFNFLASYAVVRVIPLGSGTVHILQASLIWSSVNIQAYLCNVVLSALRPHWYTARLVPGSNTICNSSSQLLADIVPFGLSF